MEVYRNTASGIPTSSYSSPSSEFSSQFAVNSGFASTSVLPASASLYSSPSALFPHASSFSKNSYPHALRLCSLSEWSQQHIRDVFEAETDEDALRAIRNTFADGVDARANGKPLPREGIDALVLAMRNCCANVEEDDGMPRSKLRVQWKCGVDVPTDPISNRDGSFGGVYVIKGIKRMVPGSLKPVEFERHKTVTVKIDSMSSDLAVDSRRITNLVFVASDVRADSQMPA
ncbi:hypothetical protein APHAL10511_007633 [Amanita phalloides]|nr:hypothetical protein APHAL10511_007633 [Amanita phalloides]